MTEQSPDPQVKKRSIAQLAGFIVLAMLVPVVPFLLGGEYLETTIEKWIQNDFSLAFRLMAVTVLLAVDIFLPVPSSAVITYAGATCGIFSATFSAWLGLTLGGLFGYELSRIWGSRLINRLSSSSDRRQMEQLAAQYGTLAIILTRPLPILGETAVLIVGSLMMGRLPFYFALLISNLAISLVYASFGNWFSDPAWLPWILAFSLIVPLLLTIGIRQILSRGKSPGTS